MPSHCLCLSKPTFELGRCTGRWPTKRAYRFASFGLRPTKTSLQVCAGVQLALVFPVVRVTLVYPLGEKPADVAHGGMALAFCLLLLAALVAVPGKHADLSWRPMACQFFLFFPFLFVRNPWICCDPRESIPVPCPTI
jgi:hypothetical protein